MAKTIYDLALNEYLVVDENGSEMTSVTRVPGGWIYTMSNVVSGDTGIAASSSSAFVPWNKEFSEDYDESGRKLGNREK